jgi:hypothetical protein
MVGMSTDVPNYVTHYAVAAREPFLNLSDLAEDALDSVLGDLARERADGASSRVFGRAYMELRRLTEEKLRQLFVAGGGRPERPAPHYFVLGASRWFRGLAPDMQEFTFKVAELPDDQTTFTYPDSVTAMGLGAAFGLHHDPRPTTAGISGSVNWPAWSSAMACRPMSRDSTTATSSGHSRSTSRSSCGPMRRSAGDAGSECQRPPSPTGSRRQSAIGIETRHVATQGAARRAVLLSGRQSMLPRRGQWSAFAVTTIRRDPPCLVSSPAP